MVVVVVILVVVVRGVVVVNMIGSIALVVMVSALVVVASSAVGRRRWRFCHPRGAVPKRGQIESSLQLGGGDLQIAPNVLELAGLIFGNGRANFAQVVRHENGNVIRRRRRLGRIGIAFGCSVVPWLGRRRRRRPRQQCRLNGPCQWAGDQQLNWIPSASVFFTVIFTVSLTFVVATRRRRRKKGRNPCGLLDARPRQAAIGQGGKIRFSLLTSGNLTPTLTVANQVHGANGEWSCRSVAAAVVVVVIVIIIIIIIIIGVQRAATVRRQAWTGSRKGKGTVGRRRR
mmetsp:Transcript_22258/g.48340  ORF Transcript_22258/g.48340 Transcript_22258/m.48340 type:complete len:286 (+) Transcript_22258:657-1514(+)